MKIPKRLRHLPDSPSHGNYYICGDNHCWAHGETLQQVCNTFGSFSKVRVMVVNVSDDFQISHMDGSIRASKVETVFLA